VKVRFLLGVIIFREARRIFLTLPAESTDINKPHFWGFLAGSVGKLAIAAGSTVVCTFVKDVRTLSEAHDPDFIKILQLIKLITTLMNDSGSLEKAA